MFDAKTGVLSVNKTRKLTQKQLVTMRQMNDREQGMYLASLLGIAQPRLHVARNKSFGYDQLASKAKGSILSRMNRLKRLGNDHTPTSKNEGQWIGVELECFIPHQSGSSECICDSEYSEDCSCNLDVWTEEDAHESLKAHLRDAGVTRVQVKEDGSLSDDEGHGVECTIVFNTAYGFEPLERLCKALRGAGCYVNDTCGMHVHLDVRGLSIAKVNSMGVSLAHSLPVIKWIVPEERHRNSYSRLRMSELVQKNMDRYNCGDRYCAINMTAWYRFKTIEVRLHSGSLNFNKIKNWINLLKVISCANLKNDITSFQELVDLPGMNEELVQYADKRITELNNYAWPLLMGQSQEEAA